MRANSIFLKQSKSFWSQVRLISMTLGYSANDSIKTHTIKPIIQLFESLDLSTDHLVDSSGLLTSEGKLLISYFDFRAQALATYAKPNLMTREQAKIEFDRLFNRLDPKVALPFNKQKKEKRHYAYLTGIINMLTEEALGSATFDADPRKLTVITRNQKPLRTLCRRVDGAFPSTVNPVAIWEIKEYYGTTTFGSRVADGVYETMLDGYEIEELRGAEGVDLKHYLIVDDYYTWWVCGKSYLCRLIDMLHEGLLDEVVFGKEAIERWPKIVATWPQSATKSSVDDRERLLRS